jgi:hypothetical protein
VEEVDVGAVREEDGSIGGVEGGEGSIWAMALV